MSVTYELLEEYTGTRTTEMPDPDNEGVGHKIACGVISAAT